SRLVGLAEHGAAGGVFLLWVATALDELPAACRTFLDVTGPWSHPGMDQMGEQPSGSAGFLHTGEQLRGIRMDWLPLELAATFARQLSPVVDAGVGVADDSDLPTSVSFLSLAGMELASEPRAVIEEWASSGSLVLRPDSQRRASRATLRAMV